jgi:hypothetical protein
MKDDPLRVRRGFVDPLYMIFFAVVGLGLALVSPILGAWLDDKAVLLWHWICLGAGIAVLAGCIAFLVRERS